MQHCHRLAHVLLLVLLSSMVAVGEHGDTEPIEVSLSSDQSRYFLGDNVLIHFTVRNVGSRPVTLDFGGDYRGARRSNRFRVEARDQSGALAPDPHPQSFDFGGLSHQPTLSAGQSYTETLALGHFRRFPSAGTYRVTVSHDLGRNYQAEASIDLQIEMPTPEQAVSIVADMAALPAQGTRTLGRRQAPYRDFWTLSNPIYLEPLIALAKSDAPLELTTESLEGIGQIATPAATKALLNFAESPVFGEEASQQLLLRLPLDPSLSAFALEEQRALAQTSWTLELRSLGRDLGRGLLSGNDQAQVELGASFLAEFGEPEDAVLLSRQLEQFLDPVSTYPRPAGLAYQLERSLVRLSSRYPELQRRDLGIGSLLLSLTSAHPDLAPSIVVGALSHPAARIRELAVLSSRPQDLMKGIEMLNDPDPGVLVALCQKLSGRPELLTLIERSEDVWVVRAVSQACPGQEWEVARRLAARLPDERHWTDFYSLLLEQVLPRLNGYSSNGNITHSQLQKLSVDWLSYLEENKSLLLAGEKLSSLPAKLIPPNFTIH